MLKIKVRGEANAQALFDVTHGMDVMWAQPFTPHQAHTLVVANPGTDLPAQPKNLFPDMRFTSTPF